MKIACLGWGSLIWDPREFKIQGEWEIDGPHIPLEFARVSSNGSLTLVITSGARMIQSLWAILPMNDLNNAIKSLKNREGTKMQYIGYVLNDTITPNLMEQEIIKWAKSKNIAAVIWTNLPPKFNGNTFEVPNLKDALNYLKNLSGPARLAAEKYVRNAPAQIETNYRSVFISELGLE